MHEGPALKKLESIYRIHGDYLRTNKPLITTLLKIETDNIC
ncbi:hypothetical protein HMPREF0493_1083 [Lactobacillus amylolyticus DSM 11664]|uniref:Uncharacterized protein n=1 Tax=Lactobacillus amylolyticus DSM 11664 TaxID=585524 RepID=D4YU72_9LACO|nr:hypothetical protein HMPREF0493_1083 [Lactobacillus amylolyticus DSM 11664]